VPLFNIASSRCDAINKVAVTHLWLPRYRPILIPDFVVHKTLNDSGILHLVILASINGVYYKRSITRPIPKTKAIIFIYLLFILWLTHMFRITGVSQETQGENLLRRSTSAGLR